MNKYIIYSKPSCGYCLQAKDLLEQNKLEFVYKQLGADYTLQELLEVSPDARTFPQIFVVDENGNKELIGGYSKLVEHLKQQY